MGEYQKMHNTNNEPLILEPEDWTREEYETLRKLFGCPVGTTRIKVTYSCVEYFKEELDNNTEIEASPCWEGGIFTGDEELRKGFTEI